MMPPLLGERAGVRADVTLPPGPISAVRWQQRENPCQWRFATLACQPAFPAFSFGQSVPDPAPERGSVTRSRLKNPLIPAFLPGYQERISQMLLWEKRPRHLPRSAPVPGRSNVKIPVDGSLQPSPADRFSRLFPLGNSSLTLPRSAGLCPISVNLKPGPRLEILGGINSASSAALRAILCALAGGKRHPRFGRSRH